MADQADSYVDDAEGLLRRVLARSAYLEWHDDFQRYVPSLAAMSFDPDGLSVTRERLLRRANLDAAALLDDRPAGVFRSICRDWREVSCDVVAQPHDESAIGFAHALVKLPPGQSKLSRAERTRLAASMQLIAGEVLPPPGGQS